jgi:hypothetical protein
MIIKGELVMRNTVFAVLLLVAIVVIVAVNCGGNGGNNDDHQAVLKLSTTGTGTIGAIDVTVQLPAGVKYRDSAPSGVAAAANPLFVVNPNVPGTVRIGIITVAGFGMGEFFTVNCNITAGATASSADFPFVKFKITDQEGRSLDGLVIPVISVEIH